MTHKDFKIIVQAQTIPERFSRVLLILVVHINMNTLHAINSLCTISRCSHFHTIVFFLCFESKVRLNLTAKTLPRLWLNICSIVGVGEPSFNLQILHLQLVLYILREDYCLSEGRRIFTISW